MENNQNKSNKIKASILTVLFHIILLLILYFAVMKSDKVTEEEGVPVMLGYVENAGGDMEPLGIPAPSRQEAEQEDADVEETAPPVASPREKAFENKAKPQPASKPLITQDQEKSIAADKAKEEAKKKKQDEEAKAKALEAKKKAEADAKAKAEAEAKRKAEAEKKKAEEEAKKRKEAAKANAANKVGTAFGKANANGSRGNTEGNGVQGSPTGNSNEGATTGVGGNGTATMSAILGNRTSSLVKPEYKDNTSQGKVVVAITVNKAGKVIDAQVKSANTSATLRNAAVAAARKSTFSAGEKETETGTITYVFRLK